MRHLGWVLVLLVLGVLGFLAYAGRAGGGGRVNPNDPATAGPRQADVMLDQLGAAYRQLALRRARGEIEAADKDRLMLEMAQRFAGMVDPGAIPPGEAFDFGEVFRAAERWKDARDAFAVAARDAAAEAERVNAHLRLAHCKAALGDFEGAERAIRATFGAEPGNKAGILLATLYEVVPLLRGKGRDVELARLLEAALGQHRKVVIDPATEPGRAFLLAAPTHIRKGWETVASLYRDAGRPEEAERARREGEKMLASFARA
jgi:tetratricopeptide (TPR) repeat protein